MDMNPVSMLTKACGEGLLKEVYGDLVKPGVSQVGQAIGTILRLGNTVLWPIQMLNEKARLTIELNLESYRKKMADIPNEKVSAVAPEIGVPTLEKLGYVQDQELRELYSSLLAKASSKDTVGFAHPSFLGIINNICPDEARFVKQYKRRYQIPFFQSVYSDTATGNWLEDTNLIVGISEDTKITYPEFLTAYISNLEGLGLLSIRRNDPISDSEWYESVEADVRERFKGYTPTPQYTELDLIRGRITLTGLGRLFVTVCVDDAQPVAPGDAPTSGAPLS